MEGESTEADKSVIEALADPLVHILRNSLDQGIKAPADRRAVGKPETATILICAAQDGDRVVIEGLLLRRRPRSNCHILAMTRERVLTLAVA